MKNLGRILLCGSLLITYFTNASAVSTFGTKATGSDLEPVSAFLSDGGEGAAFASVSFTTFQAQAGFDPLSTYLPVLQAESNGIGATFDDDRTQAEAEAYQVFTSTITQTIDLDIVLNSVVTNETGGTSGVLSNIYVFGGSDFAVQDGFCSGGQFMFDSIYMCGDETATSSRNGLTWSNLFNGGTSPLLTDTLSFTVNTGESFGIFASLSAGSFQGTADAFNTLTLDFTVGPNGDLSKIAPLTLPSPIPLPAAVWLLGSGLLGLIGIASRKKAA